jgi:hypothetical protein
MIVSIMDTLGRRGKQVDDYILLEGVGCMAKTNKEMVEKVDKWFESMKQRSLEKRKAVEAYGEECNVDTCRKDNKCKRGCDK